MDQYSMYKLVRDENEQTVCFYGLDDYSYTWVDLRDNPNAPTSSDLFRIGTEDNKEIQTIYYVKG